MEFEANHGDTALQELIQKLDRPTLENFRKNFPINGKVLTIHGVEITQGVQSYRASEHLSGTPGQRWDNTVRIVAQKPAWVRVYVRNHYFPQFSNVGGTLKVFRRRFGSFYSEIAEITPEAPGVVDAPLTADYATERGSLDNTLNFIVPANLMCGHLRFDVEIKVGSLTDKYSRKVNATLQQTLTMRIIPVSYNGVDSLGLPLTLPATSLADAQAASAWGVAAYPVRSTPDISLSAGVQLTFPLTGAPASPGGCAQSWINLNAMLAAAKVADGNIPQIFYYGLVPSNVPIGANSGCASSGVTSGRVNGQITMAHEFGHALGYGHSNCGNVGASADTSVPVYEPYDPPNISMASIGEYALDVRNGDVMAPDTFVDYMSYCGPRWISLYNYERAVQHGRLKYRFICNDKPLFDFNQPVLDDLLVFADDFPPPDPIPDPPPWREDHIRPAPDNREAVVSFIGVDEGDGRIDLRSLVRTIAVPVIEDAIATDMTAALFDKGGNMLSMAPLMQAQSRGNCGCGSGCGCEGSGPKVIQAMIRDKGRGDSLRILKGQEEVLLIKRPKNPPKPPKLSARTTKSGQVTLRWSSKKQDGPAEVWLQWRASARAEPKVLLVAGSSGTHKIATGSLPPGKGIFEAVLHDGFDSATSDRLSINIAKGPPSVAILHPYHHQSLQHGRSMQLHGLATDANGKAISPAKCHWLLDGKKFGEGLDSFVPVPAPGVHKVTLVVAGKAGKGEATSEIMVIDLRA